MTNKDAQALPEVVTCIIQFHSRPIRALIDPRAAYSLISASLVYLLGLLIRATVGMPESTKFEY